MTWKPDNEINDAENFSDLDVFLTEKAAIKSAFDAKIEEMARAKGYFPGALAGMNAPELLKKRLQQLADEKAQRELDEVEAEAQRDQVFGTWS